MNKIFLFSVSALLILGTIVVFVVLSKNKPIIPSIPTVVSPTNEVPAQKSQSEYNNYSGIISGISHDSLQLTAGNLQLSFIYSADTVITGPKNEPMKISDLAPGLPIDISARNTSVVSIKIKDFSYFVIASPIPNSPINLNSNIKGSAKYGSGYFYYKVVNRRTQSVYGDGKLKLDKKTGAYSDFSLSVGLNGALDLLDQDAIDISFSDSSNILSAKNKMTVSYIYNGGLSSKIKIYISSGKSDCGSVVPVERLVNAARSPIRSSVEEVIKGPSDTEKSRGYFSPISNLSSIRSLDLRSSVLYLDFTKNILESLVNPCDIATARAEIFQTVKQFPDIKTVVISVDGNLKNPLSQ